MMNLDSVLKSRDITLLTNVHSDKAMVFPVVMDGGKSWIIKKAEYQELMLLNCGTGEDSSGPHRQQPTWLLLPWDSPGKNTGVGCHFFLQCMKVKS